VIEGFLARAIIDLKDHESDDSDDDGSRRERPKPEDLPATNHVVVLAHRDVAGSGFRAFPAESFSILDSFVMTTVVPV
jgi:hypothetical protein